MIEAAILNYFRREKDQLDKERINQLMNREKFEHFINVFTMQTYKHLFKIYGFFTYFNRNDLKLKIYIQKQTTLTKKKLKLC